MQPATTAAGIEAVVFDIGGVLVDADYRRLYRKLIPDEERMEWFLRTVCTQEWHQRHDGGHPMRTGVAELIRQHPGHAALIEAWERRFPEVWAGPITGTVELARELAAAGMPLYLLSNWPGEKFPLAQERFPFLRELFDGEVISGFEGMLKPDPQIFALLVRRFSLTPAHTVFVDDAEVNVTAAAELGYHTIRFRDAGHLRERLRDLGVPLRPSGQAPACSAIQRSAST